ncbi:MAG: hypothetical protein HOQ07_13365 [Sinomonas sp.]|nr:hypothetical protein [Sinomonas sp.]
MYYSKFRLPGAICAGLLCCGCLAISILLPGKYPGVAWVTAGIALMSLIATATLRPRPRIGAVLFMVAGLSGAVFTSASGIHMPTELAVWAWVIIALALATVGLVEDAEARSDP